MPRKLAVPTLLVGGVLACSEPVIEPPETSESPHAALALGESWELFGIAAGTNNAVAADINDAGVIVGVINDGFDRAFRYSAGVITTYPTTPDSWMTANGINKWGQITGARLVNGTVRAYVRQANGDVVLLPYYGPAGTENYAHAINDLGEVAGMTNHHHGIRWSVAIGGWTASSMGILLDKPVTIVKDINNSGWIVGSAAPSLGSDETEAFVQMPGGPIQLIGTLGGASAADAINNSGKVFGGSELANGKARAFTWTSFGGMKDEAAIAAWETYGAISDKGRIVGTKPGPRAFTIYKGVYALLPLPPNGVYSQVFAVNSCGAIVGRVRMQDGTYRAVRWRRVVGNPPFAVCD